MSVTADLVHPGGTKLALLPELSVSDLCQRPNKRDSFVMQASQAFEGKLCVVRFVAKTAPEVEILLGLLPRVEGCSAGMIQLCMIIDDCPYVLTHRHNSLLFNWLLSPDRPSL